MWCAPMRFIAELLHMLLHAKVEASGSHSTDIGNSIHAAATAMHRDCMLARVTTVMSVACKLMSHAPQV